MEKEVKSYNELVSQSDKVADIIDPAMAEAIFATNKSTIGNLSKTWRTNTKKNIDLYKKHGSLTEAFRGFGANKAIIGIGAGPSFNLNKDYLKTIYDYNITFELDDQPFIFVASNKMLKPLLKMGIYPHFTVLTDAGDALYPQLCQGIPKWARRSILITGLHTSPKILNKWDKQGGQICFYLIGEDDQKAFFEKETGIDPELLHINQGGNVMNTIWVLANRVLGCPVYMMVGSDLSFELTPEKEKRARSFYADGDYTLNVENKRDEAQDYIKWMGFKLFKSSIDPKQTMMDMNLVGTSRQLWVYKTWLEVQATIWSDNHKFHIYNCSESGILGVLAKSKDLDALYDRNNWYLIDEVIPHRWHTRTLEKATQQFLKAYLWEKKKIENVVKDATVSPAKIITAGDIDPLVTEPRGSGIIL